MCVCLRICIYIHAKEKNHTFEHIVRNINELLDVILLIIYVQEITLTKTSITFAQ